MWVGVAEEGSVCSCVNPVALVGVGSPPPLLGHARVYAASLIGEFQLDQLVALAQALDRAPASLALGPRHPVAVASRVFAPPAGPRCAGRPGLRGTGGVGEAAPPLPPPPPSSPPRAATTPRSAPARARR